MSRRALHPGTTVLHQTRRDGRPVLERYTVRRVAGGEALLARAGHRALVRIPVAVLETAPGWAVQEALW